MPARKFCTSIALSLLTFFGSFSLQAQFKIKDSVSINPKETQLSVALESSEPWYHITIDGSCGALADANVGGIFIASAGGCTSDPELIGGCSGGWPWLWNYYCAPAAYVHLSDPVRVQIGNYPVRLVNSTPDRINDIYFTIAVTNPTRGIEYGVGLLRYSLAESPVPTVEITYPNNGEEFQLNEDYLPEIECDEYHTGVEPITIT